MWYALLLFAGSKRLIFTLFQEVHTRPAPAAGGAKNTTRVKRERAEVTADEAKALFEVAAMGAAMGTASVKAKGAKRAKTSAAARKAAAASTKVETKALSSAKPAKKPSVCGCILLYFLPFRFCTTLDRFNLKECLVPFESFLGSRA